MAELTERESDVVRLRSEGLSWTEIADELGVGRSRVSEIKSSLEEKGVDLPEPTPTLTAREQEVLDLRGESLTWAAIARRLDVSRQFVGQIKASLIEKGAIDG